ncbi:hypothetical protein COOONC_14586 [Cooperia oncophora]
MLMSGEGSDLRGRHLTPDARAVIANVKQFFAQLKEHLGATARGTILDSVTAITATACEVVERVSNTPVGRVIRRSASKSRSRKATVMAAINNHGTLWGERIKRLVHELLKEEKDVTLAELHQQMTAAYPNFALSQMTLWRLMKGLGFSYKLLKGQRYIFERADLARKRSVYLRKVEEARGRGDCVVYMDKTWVFEGMENVVSRPAAEERPQGENCLCKALQGLSYAMLMSGEGSDLRGRHLTPDARAVIANVKQFFALLKEHLGATARGTILDSVTAITATACGVSDRVVERVSNTPVGRVIRRSASRSRSRKATVMVAINNHGTLWADPNKRRLVHNC